MTPPRIVPYCTIPGLFHDATAGGEDGELHIYVPSGAVPVDGLPVLAFIHGGRFEEGSPADINGTALAREGFVVVSIGYRLGLAGFAQFHDDNPAHYRGIADVQLALEWLQHNIEGHGGDPTNITLIGQSAGAAIALWLARRDHYRGAFRRLVALSPSFPTGGFPSRKRTLRLLLGAPITRDSLSRFGDCGRGAGRGNRSAARLRRAYRRFRSVYFAGPALGPWPWDTSELADVPILVTSTHDEFHNEPITSALDRWKLGGVAAWALRVCGVGRGVSGASGARQFIADTIIHRWVRDITAHHAGQVWRGKLVGKGDEPAVHCDDLRLLFEGGSESVFRSDVLGFARSGRVDWPEKTCKQWTVDG